MCRFGRCSQLVLCALAALLLALPAYPQGVFATLTGVVSDPSGQLVPNAKVILRNADSQTERTTATDNTGYYTFASVNVGTYNLSVEAPGFQTFRANGIALTGGDKRNVNASLQISGATQTVEVTGTPDIITPTDSGEKSDTLTSQQLQNYIQVGSNAAEYMKVMPGFGVNNGGTSNTPSYTGQTIGINANGDSGSQSPLNNAFSYNGLPGNTLDILGMAPTCPTRAATATHPSTPTPTSCRNSKS